MRPERRGSLIAKLRLAVGIVAADRWPCRVL